VTPSAARLLGLIKHRSGFDQYWVRLNLSELASFMDLTPRTLARAKAELDSMGLVKFRTISNGEGRGHKLHAALSERLKGKRGELLHCSRCGKERHSWDRIGGNRIHRPTRRPHDISYTKGSLREHQKIKTLPAKAILSKRNPTKRQIAFAHWLKRDLWDRSSWDNLKIERSDAHLFGFALRSIVAGHDAEKIHRCFERALKEMHGTATDVGLLQGNPTSVRFSLSSTVSRAGRMLSRGEFVTPYKKELISTGIVTDKRAIGVENSNRKAPREQRLNQSARILGIIEALA
jgi:hypothetical protein